MFRFAQHDSVRYDMLSAGTTVALQKHLVRNLKSRGLFSDADKNYGNRARTGRRQRAATARARW